MIAVIDYDIGNLGSVIKALDYLGVEARLTRQAAEIRTADGLILPGVGAFGQGMYNLQELNLLEVITEVTAEGRPFLGICLGMQLMFSHSEEDQNVKGLDMIKGSVRRFKPEEVGKVPHIGWNQVDVVDDDPLFAGIKEADFYFVHSYYAVPESTEYILGTTRYGTKEFVSVVRKDNIWGIQCHPEKSSQTGLKFLKNFCEVVC